MKAYAYPTAEQGSALEIPIPDVLLAQAPAVAAAAFLLL